MEIKLRKHFSEPESKNISNEDKIVQIAKLSNESQESFWISALSECVNLNQFKDCLKLYRSYKKIHENPDLGEKKVKNEQSIVIDNQNPQIELSFKITLVRICFLIIRNNPNFETILSAYQMLKVNEIKFGFLDQGLVHSFEKIAIETTDMIQFYNHLKQTKESDNENIFLKLIKIFCKKCHKLDNETNIENLETSFDIYCYIKENNMNFEDTSIEKNFNDLCKKNLHSFDQKNLWTFVSKKVKVLNESLKQEMNKIYYEMIEKKYECKEIKETYIKIITQSIYSHEAPNEFELFIYKGKLTIPDQKAETINIISKKYKNIIKEMIISEAIREGHFLQKFSQNELFIKFFGLIKGDNEISLIMEECDCTLNEFIKKLENPEKFEYSRFLEMSERIAKAVYFMKKEEVVHRDIKPENIFMIRDKAKLADFSVSHYLKDIRGNSGTKGYKAPELNKKNHKCDWYKCDIFSFGVTLIVSYYSIYKNPDEMQNSQIGEKMDHLTMLAQVEDTYLRALLRRMTDENPDRRPDIEAVIGYLQAISIKVNRNALD